MPADVSQLEALAAFLADARIKIVTEERKVVAETTRKVERSAKSHAPVDTGALQASISGEARGLRGKVETDLRYAEFVEFGTYKDSPQPFMTPALEENQSGFFSDAEEAAQRALEG